MNRQEGRRKGFWPGVILVSFLAAMITFFVMLHVEKNILSDYEKVLVWCAGTEIPRGKEITGTEPGDYFVQIEVDKKSIPDKAVMSTELLIGKQASITIPRGSFLTTAMFTDSDSYTSSMSQPVVAGCKGEDLFQMVSGVLRKGDQIHVYVVNENLEQTYLLWENVMVYQVFDSAGNLIPSEDMTTPAARINLLLEKSQAEQFYNELQTGSLRFVKVCKAAERGGDT